MNITTPDPFTLPKSPDLTSEEILILKDIIHGNEWALLKKIWDWYTRNLTWTLYNVEKDHSIYQGMIKGLALAQDLIERRENYLELPKLDGPDLTGNSKDDIHAFSEKWKSRSKQTGY